MRLSCCNTGFNHEMAVSTNVCTCKCPPASVPSVLILVYLLWATPRLGQKCHFLLRQYFGKQPFLLSLRVLQFCHLLSAIRILLAQGKSLTWPCTIVQFSLFASYSAPLRGSSHLTLVFHYCFWYVYYLTIVMQKKKEKRKTTSGKYPFFFTLHAVFISEHYRTNQLCLLYSTL